MQSKKKNLYALAWRTHVLDKIWLRVERLTAMQAATLRKALQRACARKQIYEFKFLPVEKAAKFKELRAVVPGVIRRRKKA